MPAMIGEYCYEGHMQTAFQDVQRYVFWGSLLSGAAGLTYGAAGVWHASVEGDPGIANVYDWTTWKEGMNALGSTQIGLGKISRRRDPRRRNRLGVLIAYTDHGIHRGFGQTHAGLHGGADHIAGGAAAT